MMPLNLANPGDSHVIKRITGKDEVRQHLAELGFVAGTTVTLVNRLGGNVILEVKGTRVALDSQLTRRIMI